MGGADGVRVWRAPSRPWVALLLGAACSGKPDDRPTLGDDDDETTTPPECVDDVDCVFGREICEENTCIPGDRDNSFDEARAVGLGDQAASEGWIFPPGDVDVHVYNAPRAQWVWFGTVSNADTDLDTIVSVYDAEGNLHAIGDGFPVHPFSVVGTLRGQDVDYDTVLFVYLPTAGPWYVQVEDRTTFDGAPKPGGGRLWHYDLVAIEAPGATEPDGTDAPWIIDMADLTTIYLLGVVVDEPGDVDHIQVDFPFDARTFEVWGQPDTPGSDAAPLVTLFHGADRVAEKAGLGGDAGWLSWFRASAGTLRIEATDAAGGGGRDSWFMLYLRTYGTTENHPFFGREGYQPELAPNDTPAEAQALVADVEPASTAFRLDGVIEAAGDVDWWLVEANETDTVGVTCWTARFGSLARLDVTLATGGGTEFLVSDAPVGDVFVSAQPMPGPGPLEVRIRDRTGQGGVGHYYRCAIEVTPG